MKKTIIKTAKTKEKAINDGLKEINKRKDQVTIEVIEEESNGFLGLIGQKDAVVKIIYEEDFEESFEQIKEELGTEELVEEIINSKEEEKKEKEDLTISIDNSNKEEVNDKKEEKRLVEEKEDKEKENSQTSNIEKYYRAKDFLKEILESMHFNDVKVIGNLEGNIIKLDAKIDEKDTGIAIGKGGKTIDAIELILRKSLKSRINDLKINIDINNYKKRRDDKIIEQADYAARKVQKTNKKWNLKYMNSYERRLAHEQISKYNNLTSYSEGQEPHRFVVVDIVEE